MKICSVIAEYNPLHNGHLRHINFVREALHPEKIVVVMGGNFTQRGEPALLDKYTRATHAIKAGADAVIELPTVFATANAELFAKGGVKIINSINNKSAISFGVESGTKQEFLTLADALANETKEFKKALKLELDKGVSFAKAKTEAVKSAFNIPFAEELMTNPNNVLALEYTKAIRSFNLGLEIFPFKRTGYHNDKKLYKNITSATSIRENVKLNKTRKVKKCVPDYTYKSLEYKTQIYSDLAISAIIQNGAEMLKKTPDCTEGLENRISVFAKKFFSLDEIVRETATKRYTETRVRRIILANLLGITDSLLKESLSSPLYAKILAIKKGSNVLSVLGEKSTIPLLTRKGDESVLNKKALNCFLKDVQASELYNLITKTKQNPFQMLIV